MKRKKQAGETSANPNKLKTSSMICWAAFNPETGECMAPTIRSWQKGAVEERDHFYPGCPIFQCNLVPLFPDDAKHQQSIVRSV